ncbi:protein CFAP20DC-like isoform X2 [Physella acuta]|uniref:protein CFAP20DC-like isoform X2 n=1 Tax=Physella acuta TaxID=109671 RepID=UPI0027DC3755|nr:protein CFAP20DC-like isoform X2 [Physella acuta]
MSFKNGFQGGPFFELFSLQGRDSMNNWKISNSGIKKTYEKEVKGYILALEGASATTKVQAPKDQKQSLTLVQRFLVLQIYLSKGADFSMELSVTDLGNNKRRILLSTSQKEVQVTPLHAKVPLTIVKKAIWLNLTLDMVSLVGEMWTGQTFRSVDQISISANCRLRRVFTMKSQPPDTTEDEELDPSINSGEMDNIPKNCQFAPDVQHFTQVITLNKIKHAERVRSGKGSTLADQYRPGSTLELDLNASGKKIQTADGKIAFGSKAPRVPESGRKTSRQGSVTNRSLKSQTSRNDGVSNQNTMTAQEMDLDGGDHFDISRSHHPGSAGSVHQDPVSLEEFTNGLKDKQLVAPHPPREPSNDRVRRRPRIKTVGQNGVLNRGDGSVISPPTSATLSSQFSRGQPGQSYSVSPSQAYARDRLEVNSILMKDSGVGPDVPEIQSPRKGETSNYDSVVDVISLLRQTADQSLEMDNKNLNNNNNNNIYGWNKNDDLTKLGKRKKEMSDQTKEADVNVKTSIEDDDSVKSNSASDSSHLGEYEESEDETSGDTNKLHLFVSPPKSATLRRNISPNNTETDANQSKKSVSRNVRSNMKRSTDTSYRGARLEDDFVSHSSSEDEMAARTGADVYFHTRHRRHAGSAGSVTSHRHLDDGYNSNNYASPLKVRGHSGGSRPRPVTHLAPQNSTSPDQKPTVHSARRERDSVTRMSKKALREITNPHTDDPTTNNERPYDATKYQMEDLTESFEARMYASMRRQGEEEERNISPVPTHASSTLHRSQPHLNPADLGVTTHLCSESPATTSDDDTSFSTWKAPAPNQTPHNYQDEMKSQRSSDTLTSSNPRDWSGVMSPPIGPLSHIHVSSGPHLLFQGLEWGHESTHWSTLTHTCIIWSSSVVSGTGVGS